MDGVPNYATRKSLLTTYSEKHSYTQAGPHASGPKISKQYQGDTNREPNQVVEDKVHYRSNLLSPRASNDTRKSTLHNQQTIILHQIWNTQVGQAKLKVIQSW